MKKLSSCLWRALCLLTVVGVPVASWGADTLIPRGATWKYLDDGTDQGTAWRTPGFSDAAWKSGPAQLGYGEGDEATVVASGPANSKFITTYFRHTFTANNPSSYTVVRFQVKRDDGVVLYLNGTEIYRNGLGNGTILFDTTASNAPDDGQTFLAAVTVDPALLVNGANLMAAEIHQDSATSSDISFDFELVASQENNPPVVTLDNPPTGRVFIAPADVTLRAAATDPESNLAGVEFYVNGALLSTDSGSPFNAPWNAVPVGVYSLYAVAFDSLGLRSTSTVASVSVEASSAPVIAGRTPAPGPVQSLGQLTVTFSEAVSGVRAQDLLINGRPAASVSGAGAVYVFGFPQPAEGVVQVGWEGRTEILDFEPAPRRFDPLSAGASWQYILTDTVAPTAPAAAIQPAPGATVRSLSTIRVTFSEPVTGVDAADLRVNGVAAISVSGTGSGPYEFEVAQPANGAVAVTWAAGHGIRDLAAAGNAFAGAGWNYTLNTLAVHQGAVVLNEVMYHPASERTADEWIELLNRGNAPLNLAGWSISRGVSFTFPSVTLPAGGYLVVAADVAAFQARYPGVTNVVGGWTGQLNNTDEEIEIEDANGDRVDGVLYADEGDFAVRRRAPNLAFAWEWYAEHDGLGKSLELRQPALSNQSGQNWGSSGPVDGTPGRVNSLATGNLAPLILDVAHAPVVPRSSDPVRFTARLVDELATGVVARVWWRSAGTTNPPAFTAVTMLDDGAHGDGLAGDGIFGGSIGAQADLTVVEYYIEAVDGAGATRTWPAAALDGGGAPVQLANALLQVDNSVYGGRQPVFRLVLTESDRVAFAAQNRNTEALVNCSLVAFEGATAEVRHGAGIRYRGAGSRGRNPPTYRLNIPSDRRWSGRTALNLNSQYVHSQVVGSQIAIQSGLVTEYARAVQLRINGVNPANAGLPQFGSYAAVEPTNAELMENHLPDDDGGNVYRASIGAHTATLNYLGTSPTAYINAGYIKNSNASENDWTDLMALTFALDPATTPDNEYVGAVRRNLNVDLWLRYFVVGSLLEYTETALVSGRGDDYGLYRGLVDPRFMVLFHDFDTVLGQGDTGGNVNEDIYVAGGVATMNRFLRHPEFEPLFHAEFRRQIATTFSTNSLFPLIDQYLADWVPAQTIQGIKNFAVARVAGVLAQLPPEPVRVIATVGGEPASPTYLNAATLTVGGAGVTHYRHRVNGGAFGPETPVGTPIQLTGLADGVYTVSVIGRDAAGTWQAESSATLSRTWTVLSSLRTVVINEVLARNAAAVNLGGSYPDLVELFNPRVTAVDLGGWRMTDDLAEPGKFTFPPGTTLAPGGYLVLVADSPDGTAALHLGFGLGQDGETLHLLEPAAAGGRVVDAVEFGFQLVDRSIGRLAGGHWGLCVPSFGQANTAAAVGDPAVLRINEWLASGVSPFPDDFIELYNPGAAPVALGGLYLTDRVVGRPFQHRITPLSYLDGFAYRAFIADGDDEAGADHVGFQLGSEQGEIGLLDGDGRVLDSIIYGPQSPGIAEGRAPNGGSRITRLSPPTPGGPNPVPPPPVTPQVVNLLPLNDTFQWRYNDTGADLGTAWIARAYDDSAWPSGPGVLGFDTGFNNPPEPIRTTLSLTNNRITYYFRARFTVPAGLVASELQATHMTDDGAVFYLNGQEAARFNMPAAPTVITNRTLASSSHEGNVFETTTLSLSGLVAGENVIAVEVHQNAGTSTDIVFGMRLDAIVLTNAPSVAGVRLHEVFAASQTVTNSDGTVTDWVELQNPSNAAVDVGGMSLTDDVAESRRWVFPTGSVVPAGGYLVVRCDPDRSPSTNAGPVLNTGFALNASGDQVFLFDRPADGGALLDAIAFGVQATDYSLSRAPGGTNWVLSLPTPAGATLVASLGNVAGVVFNEWMADPGSGEDWFELYNPSAQPVAIGGLRLSDDSGDLGRSPLPDFSFLGTGLQGFQRFEADGDPALGGNHVDFRLSASGETLLLSTTNGVVLASVSFGAQAEGVSEGRLPDGGATVIRFPGSATPGDANVARLRQVVVNEVLTHTDAPLEDAIELHNPTAQGLDISGWYLSDRRSDLRRYRIPDGTVIGPLGHVVFYEAQFNPDGSGLAPYFSLDSTRGDDVYVSEATAGGVLTGYRTSVRFGGAQNGVSFGQVWTTAGGDFTAMSRRSFGSDAPTDLAEFRLGRGAANPGPLVGPVVVSEIQYHARGVGGVENELDEFIELRNVTNVLVTLYDVAFPTNTWRLRDAVDFEFPQGATLTAGGHLVVVGFDPAAEPTLLAAFRQRYGIGAGVPVYGPWRGRLQNSSDNVELYKPDMPQPPGTPDAGFVPYVLADKVRYEDANPWPTLADGSTNGVAYSLNRRAVTGYGNEATNWVAAAPSPGAASAAPALTPPQIQSISAAQAVQAGATATVVASPLGASPLSVQWFFEGALIPGATNVVLTVPSFQATNAGVYSVVVVNPAGSAAAVTRVDVRSVPVILRQPLNVGAGIGETALLGVVASGTPPLSYQWQRNGTNVAGGTGALLVIANAQAANDGSYRVILTNAFGAVTSQVATLIVRTPPAIVQQPQGADVLVGASVTLSVQATGAAPLRYQWQKDGANVPNATNASLAFTSARVVDSGSYRVVVSNAVGSVLSDAAILNVSLPPTLTIAATTSPAEEGTGAPGRFTISRSGSLTASLQVGLTVAGNAVAGSDYTALPGVVTFPAGTNALVLTVNPLNDAVTEGTETVVVTVQAGAGYGVGSPSVATVQIVDDDNRAPVVTLTSPGAGTVLTAPATATFAATASDPDGQVARVEFLLNGTIKLGEAVAAPYSITVGGLAAGNYDVTAVATDTLGASTVSAPVRLIVNAAPTVAITAPANGAILSPPATVAITVSAADSDGSVARVEILEGGNLLATLTSAPYAYTWANVAAGAYGLTARAVDDRGATTVSSEVRIQVQQPSPTFADLFAARGVLTAFTNVVLGTNSSYTREAGEPRHESRLGAKSAWISWVAPASGPVTMSTLGSSFDTVLSIYTGSVVSNLVRVAGNDDANDLVVQSAVTFTAVGGTAYQIAVDGFSATAGGSIRFSLEQANLLPVITAQPAAVTVNQGVNATFSVGAAGPGPLAYRWRLNGTAINNATNATYTRNSAQPVHEGLYTVVITNTYGAVTSAPAQLLVRTAPVITSQPFGTSVAPGETATFSVTATGWSPLRYQWRFGGTDLAGQTNATLTLVNVQAAQEGVYSVVITNVVGSVTSASATLQVMDGLVQYEVSELIPMTGSWRYDQSGVDRGTAWRAFGYDDSGWPVGGALFGFEDSTPYPYVFPIGTPLTAPSAGGPITTYFRTRFAFTNGPGTVTLFSENLVDDGAAYYLNGVEAGRLRLGANATNFTSLATTVNPEGQSAFLNLASGALVRGENVLAVEVHQSSATSSDVVFGMSLTAVVAFTNPPVILEAARVPGGGGFAVTVGGIAGRTYALESAPSLGGSWTSIATFTNFTGQATHVDTTPAAATRFYRGRLVR